MTAAEPTWLNLLHSLVGLAFVLITAWLRMNEACSETTWRVVIWIAMAGLVVKFPGMAELLKGWLK